VIRDRLEIDSLSYLEENRRKGKNPVPENLSKYMNSAQLHTYHLMQKFGWDIKFIRRPLFQDPVCVLTDPEKTTLAVVEEDGFLNRQPDIPLRSFENPSKY
jgi:hypothetical protein